MNTNPGLLLTKIELCREEMVELAFKENFSSEAVIAVSVKLDKLLNQYEKATGGTEIEVS